MISYIPLWETLKEKGISQYQLLQLGVDKHTLQNLRDNKSITMNTLEYICNVLGCKPNDVVDFNNDSN